MWVSKSEIKDSPLYGDLTNGSSVFIPDSFWGYVKRLPICERSSGKGKKKRTTRCINKIVALDTEATTVRSGMSKGGRDFAINPIAFTYSIQIQFDADYSFFFRRWSEVVEFFAKVVANLPADENGAPIDLIVYVHNLSYEFQFMKHEFDFDDVMAVDSRKVLKAHSFGIEWRCSWLQTNMSLYTFTKDMGAKHVKAKSAKKVYDAGAKCYRIINVESYDYDRARFPWSEISEHDMHYCMNDVLGLVEAINVRMNLTHDNLLTIPLTSTGYVRRDMKKALAKHKRFVNDIYPDPDLYLELREAFRGGNTHANRHYAGQIINNVYSFDRSSSYPDVQCNRPFPMEQFTKVKPRAGQEIRDYMHYVGSAKFAVICRMTLANVRLKSDEWGCPYISKDKSRNIFRGVEDNGRILSADLITITITDVDFRIIVHEYDFDIMNISDIWISRYGMLPKTMRTKIIEYYMNKTSLKGIPEKALEYRLAKALLNAIYGMTAQDNLKDDIIYNYSTGEFDTPHYDTEADEMDAFLERYAQYNGKAFISYAWGCWTTAWARYELERGIQTAVNAGGVFLYTDTDSVKVAGDKETLQKAFDKLNERYIANSTKNGSHAADKKGIEHYTGVYENDAEYSQFATLGAKKYAAYERVKYLKDDDGKEYRDVDVLEITIAGVGKDIGAEELNDLGGLKAFKPGTIFTKAGGTCSKYIEEGYCYHPDDKQEHTIVIKSGLAILPSEYTLNITGSYSDLIGVLMYNKNADRVKL